MSKGDKAEREHQFRAGDVILAKIKGFPAWPGILVDDADVPREVRAEKPASKPFTVRFFPAADYHWATARELSLLTPEAVDAFLGDRQKKSADLRKAYQIARDPHAWNAEKNRIVQEHEAFLESGGAAEQDADEEEEEEAPPRKRRSAQAARKPPAAKKAKAEPKAEEPEAQKPDEQEEELDPATKRVREWRHKLQRAFLNKEGVIAAGDMDTQHATFQTVEAYNEMTPEQLKVTKIGKVMKRIHQLPEIPRDDEFHFRQRAGELMSRWGAILGAQTERTA